MSTSWKHGALVVLGLAVAVGLLAGLGQSQTAGQGGIRPTAVAGPHYSVVETEGHNLIVTDNKTNILYFYTIDKDQEVGADLKLRGSLDLNNVGQAVLHPVVTKAKRTE